MTSWLRNLLELLTRVHRLRPHLRGGRYLVGAVMLSAIAGAFLEGVGVGLLVPLFSLLVGEDIPMRPLGMLKGWLPGRSAAFYVVTLCSVVFGAIAAKNIFIYFTQILGARLRRRVAVNLRASLFERLHRAEINLFEQHASGEISSIFFHETDRAMNLLDTLLLITQRVCIGGFYLISLLIISAPLTLFTVLLGLCTLSLIVFLYRRLSRSGEEVSQLQQRLFASVAESFAGIRVVRATHSEQREFDRFQQLNRAHSEAHERSVRANALLSPITETVAVAGAMLIIGGAYTFLVQPGLMRATYLLGFGVFLVRLLPLVTQVYGLMGNLLYYGQSLKEVGKWLESPPHPTRPFGDATFTGVSHAIRLEQVSHTYGNGTQALREVSFVLPAGKTVALVGASGSGKSTVASLLLRFRPLSGGKITVDDRDYQEFSAESWHTAVAVVEQEAFLFHDSLAANIAYGFPQVSVEAVEAAVRIAHLDDLVKGLPQGLKTIVGERGALLSGGQRQRLAIARAVVRNPQVLILDEATSALDSLSEREVQNALEEAMRGRTVLVIAHRLSTIRNADHIVVLEEGRVGEQGSWEELINRGGMFAKMVNSTRDPAGRIT